MVTNAKASADSQTMDSELDKEMNRINEIINPFLTLLESVKMIFNCNILDLALQIE